ncbi:MAG: hypothetical protein K0S74_1398 [Chlamydiales bacterium]|jgi:ribonuclease P protein component|nr:hypothetical protein [Chlamydiales bacterium]
MYSFPKSARLLKRKQFQKVQSAKCSIVGSRMIIQYYIDPHNAQSKLGIAASRHFGNSVQRNRFKRLCREAFRLLQRYFPSGSQVIIKPRPYALSAKLCHITAELSWFIKQLSSAISKSN